MIHRESWFREITSSKQDILQYLKGPVTFEELPPEYGEAVAWYLSEIGEKGDAKNYNYGEVPSELLAKEIAGPNSTIEDVFQTWSLAEEGGAPDYGPEPRENRWPVIIAENYKDILDDGWHRFWAYYFAGHKTIPVVERVRKGKKKVASDFLTLYHVTPSAKLRSIKKKGLVPSIGPRSQALGESKPCLYFFKNKDDVEDALMNWLGEEFEEDEPLALLEVLVEPQAVSEEAPDSFEVVVCVPIPPDNIRVLEKDL